MSGWRGSAVPVHLQRAQSAAVSNSSIGRQSVGYSRPTCARTSSASATTAACAPAAASAPPPRTCATSSARTCASVTKGWKKKRILLYAHGGLVPEDSADPARRRLPRGDARSRRSIRCASSGRPTSGPRSATSSRTPRARAAKALIEKAKDLLLDRLDDTLEPLARTIGGKALWDEMKENALLATTAVARGSDGGWSRPAAPRRSRACCTNGCSRIRRSNCTSPATAPARS